ncbi:MAG: glycoside hydrolase domain-containing protein [Promethearchaeota archaeon]
MTYEKIKTYIQTSLFDYRFIAILVLFISNYLLFENSVPLSNYFDTSRYYLFLMVLPGVLMILITIIMQRILSIEFLFKIYLFMEIVSLFILGYRTLMFQTFNADNLMYISGYIMIYERILYWFMLSFNGPLLYLISLNKIYELKDLIHNQISDFDEDTQISPKLKSRNIIQWLPNLIFKLFLDNLIIAAIFTFILILISVFWSLGIFYILLGLLLEISLLISKKEKIIHKTRLNQKIDQENPRNTNNTQFDANENKFSRKSALIQKYLESSSRFKNFLLSLISFLFITTISYLLPIDYIFFYENKFNYFARDSHRSIYYSIQALLIFILIAASIRYIYIKLMNKKITKFSNEEILNPSNSEATSANKVEKNRTATFGNKTRTTLIFGLIAVLLALGLLGTMMLGISPFETRLSLIILPWAFISYFVWIEAKIIKRKVESPGLWGAILILSILGLFAGTLLGIEADSDYSYIIWIAVLLLSIVLIVFSEFVVNSKLKIATTSMESNRGDKKSNKTRKVKQNNQLSKVATLMPLKEISQKFSNILNLNEVKNKSLKSFIVLALVCIPCFLIYVPSQSPSNFQILANVDNYCIFYFADPMSRIDQNYKPNFGLSSYKNINNTIEISAAKNEYESIQIVMLPINQNHMSIYEVSFSGFAHESNKTKIAIPSNSSTFFAYNVRYIDALGNIIADMLENFSSIAVSDGKNHPLWFTFYIPKDIPSGNYNGTLQFLITNRSTDDTGFYTTQTVNFNINLNVYNFTLPTIPSLKSNFGFSDSYPRYDEVMQWFKEHRMMRWSFFTLPKCKINETTAEVDYINFTLAESEIQKIYSEGTYTIGFHFYNSSILPNEPFLVNGTYYNAYNYTTNAPKSLVDATYKSYFDKLEEILKNSSHIYIDDFGNNHTWFDDIYLNGPDEIEARSEEVINNALAEYRWLKNDIEINFPIMQTIMGPPDWLLNELMKYIDIFCWHTEGFEADYITTLKENGKEIWIYTTRGPRFPSPTASTTSMATQLRALGWQCFVFNYSHYLIWDVATPRNGDMGYGYQGWNGGSLLYRTPYVFTLSTRLELIREGFEDYEYFNLLKLKLTELKNSEPNNPNIDAGNKLLKQINELFIRGYDPQMNYKIVEQLRNNIADFLNTI